MLELNCGTGTDALFLSSLGIAVTACDASPRMIEQAEKQKAMGAPRAAVDFRVLCTERLDELPSDLRFDGVFSNFSGLNCVPDLSKIWKLLAERLRARRAGSDLPLDPFLCVGNPALSLQGGLSQSLSALPRYRRGYIGAKFFPRLLSNTAFLAAVALAYVSFVFCHRDWCHGSPFLSGSLGAQKPVSLALLRDLDRLICEWPGIRALGDHMLLRLERVEQWRH